MNKTKKIEEQKLESETILVQRHDVFYDDEQTGNLDVRSYSEILFLRSFNNWAKSVLISRYVERLPLLKPTKPSVFDLCSGKGGDFFKWSRYNMSHYVALEYQEALIDEAINRRNESAKQVKFPSIFLVADAGDEKNTVDKILENKENFGNIRNQIEFDIVSC